ncbi:MAG: MBOAT family O-acyltransferase [Bacteroidia bacterium]
MNWTGFWELFLHDEKEPLLFHTGFFLFIFSIFLLAYAWVYKSARWRNIFVIGFGFYFYYKASGIFLGLLILTISADYLFSILMERTRNLTARKAVLTVAILFSLSFLLFFKYTNFFLENAGFLAGRTFEPLDLILPIGISFYTFQSISYLVDIYKEKIKRPTYSDYLMYMSFFPHLVAGPIVRARDFLPQLRQQVVITKSNVDEAMYLITKGLVKKAIIGDYVAQYSDAVFAQPDGFSGTENLFGSLSYTLQIFCDFSGYTDMAIGVALLLGFRLGLNFDSPYKALNITDFWRRWHISLSSWLRDYIYIPMGGNRKGFIAQQWFLLATMLIGGFWHGASWKFVFWGAGHGILLILHKLFTKVWPDNTPPKPKAPLKTEVHMSKDWVDVIEERPKFTWQMLLNPIWWVLTFGAVSLLWIPFRADSMETSFQMYEKIFSGFDVAILEYAFEINPLLYILLGLGFLATIQPGIVKRAVRKAYCAVPLIFKLVLLVVLIQVFIQVRSESVQPFIYFQF